LNTITFSHYREFNMARFRPLLAAAVLSVALPLAISSDGFAQQAFGGGGARGGGGGAPAAAAPSGGGGGGFSGGGGRSFGGGAPQMSGPRMGGGPVFNGGGAPRGGQVFAGPTQSGGNWNPGPGMRPPYHRPHRPHWGGGWGGGFWPGVGVGAAFASAPYYYGDSYYYDDGYYDDGYVVQAAPDSGDVSYCVQRYKSYDINSRTYLGYDGQRHPCP
jgi:hypothetical protein